MSWLLDLVELAQSHTWVMLLVLWLTVVAGGKVLHSNISTLDEDVGTLAENQDELQDEVQAVDLKQDHIVERQEMVLEQMGMNEQEIQELRERHARMEAQRQQRNQNPDEGSFFRGGSHAADGGGD